MWLLPLAQQPPALLGFILFRLTLDGEDDTETLYVYELQVAEKARRLGLGKHLMQVGCGSGWPRWCAVLAHLAEVENTTRNLAFGFAASSAMKRMSKLGISCLPCSNGCVSLRDRWRS